MKNSFLRHPRLYLGASSLIVALALCFDPTAHAQLVADGATYTINNTGINLGAAELIIGTNGPNTSLIITNNGRLTNAFCYVGFYPGSTNNRVMVTGAGSLWNNTNGLILGYQGSGNTLLITNGGTVMNSNDGQDVSMGSYYFCSNNQVIVSGPGSALFSRGGVGVGGSGSFNTLLITNGGTVTNNGATVGAQADARHNQAIVTGTGSVWNSGSVLYLGSSGSSNRLHVAGGGTVSNLVGYIGYSVNAIGNEAVVSGTNSVWNNTDKLYIGYSGSKNQLLITNGGTASNPVGYIGYNVSASSNRVVVSGAGSTWNNDDLRVGFLGSGNTLLITDGGAMNTPSLAPVGHNAISSNNLVIVSGTGSTLKTSSELHVGSSGSYNALLISDGGVVTDTFGTLGNWPGANYNTAIVSGTGSLWHSTNGLNVGYNGSFNTLLITNGGKVEGFSLSFVGRQPGSTNNCVTVDGGTLRIPHQYDIRRGTNILNAGLVEVDSLILTSPQGFFEFNGGTLKTYTATVSNGQPFVVGNNLASGDPALWDLQQNLGLYTFANGLLISSNASVIGSGTISGTVTVAAGGNLSPGNSLGKLILSNAPALQGNLLMEISKSGATLTNDQLQVISSLAYGGALSVTNIGPDTLALGNSFKLFSATSGYSGGFASTSLPPLPAGLSWTNKLLIDGTIAVVAGPTALNIGGLTRSGTNLIYNVSGGSAGGTWKQLTSTNVALPLASWITNRSGIFDGLGYASLTNGINPAEPQRYFRIKTP